MQLSPNSFELRKAVVISIFASLAIVLGIIESFIPFAVAIPGAKLGLGNIMVVTCIYMFSGKDALSLIVLKTLLTAFVLGSFSTFMFSLFGALGSFIVMYAMIKLGRGSFSLMGVSVMGGVMHNVGQLTAASIVLGTTKIYYYFPFLLISGVVTGIFVGLAAKHLIQALDQIEWFRLSAKRG